MSCTASWERKNNNDLRKESHSNDKDDSSYRLNAKKNIKLAEEAEDAEESALNFDL